MTNPAPELRVAAKTPISELASAIAHALYSDGKVTLRAIGAGAVNQSVKGIAVAQGHVSQRGLILATRPGFVSVNLGQDKEDVTAIVFYVFTLDQ